MKDFKAFTLFLASKNIDLPKLYLSFHIPLYKNGLTDVAEIIDTIINCGYKYVYYSELTCPIPIEKFSPDFFDTRPFSEILFLHYQ